MEKEEGMMMMKTKLIVVQLFFKKTLFPLTSEIIFVFLSSYIKHKTNYLFFFFFFKQLI